MTRLDVRVRQAQVTHYLALRSRAKITIAVDWDYDSLASDRVAELGVTSSLRGENPATCLRNGHKALS